MLSKLYQKDVRCTGRHPHQWAYLLPRSIVRCAASLLDQPETSDLMDTRVLELLLERQVDFPEESSVLPAAEPSAPPVPKKDWSGYLDLLGCAVLIGTYNPVLKLIFAEDHPMEVSTLTCIRTIIAAAAMGIVIAAKPRPTVSIATDDVLPNEVPTQASVTVATPLLIEGAGALLMLAAGVELGIYLFVEVATETVGLQLTSATRAGFLTQSTAVLTPILCYLVGERISPQMWTAVGFGLLGSCLVAYGGITAESADLSAVYPDEFTGVLLLLTSSLAISAATIRLGALASRFCPIDLAAIRQITLGVMSVAWFLGQQHQGIEPGMPLDQQLDVLGLSGRSAGSWALILYSALGPGALATYLQTKGQSTVPATPSQLIHSTTPIWSASVAMALCLGGETMGPLSWAGAVAVIGASVLAASGTDHTIPQCDGHVCVIPGTELKQPEERHHSEAPLTIKSDD